MEKVYEFDYNNSRFAFCDWYKLAPRNRRFMGKRVYEFCNPNTNCSVCSKCGSKHILCLISLYVREISLYAEEKRIDGHEQRLCKACFLSLINAPEDAIFSKNSISSFNDELKLVVEKMTKHNMAA